MLSTPRLAGLATRLAAPARLLAIGLNRSGAAPARKSRRSAPLKLVESGAVMDRLHLPILPQSFEAGLWAETVSFYARLAAAGKWADILKALREADQARGMAPGGRSLAELIAQGARADLAAALERQDWAAALAEIEVLADMRRAHAEDAMAASLLALSHLDYALARQKAEPGPGVPREVWSEITYHAAYAEAALEDFDPIEEDSPLLAAARYHLVRFIEDGAALCRDWYEDWSDLDPQNPEPHLAHAVHLLPKWFGTLGDFDAEARQAMQRTRHRTGAAAYALFQMAAAECLGDLPPDVDIPLYISGLIEHFRATGCQARANSVAAALARLDRDLAQSGAYPEHAAHVRAALAGHMRRSVQELHLSAWGQGEALILHAFAQVFADEFARGAHIYPSPEGLLARLPG